MPPRPSPGYPAARERVLVVSPVVGALGLQAARGERASGGTIQGAVVGEFSHVQIFNPGDSMVRLFIESVLLNLFGADFSADLRRFNTPLTNLFLTWRLHAEGIPLGRAQLRVQTSATALGDNIMRLFDGEGGGISGDGLGILLRPGQGLLVGHTTLNTALSASYVGAELPL